MNASQTLHPTDQTLNAYGLGKLDDALAETLNEHVESCCDCQRRVAELSSDSFLGRLRGAQGKHDSSAPIMSATDGVSMLAAGSASPAPPPNQLIAPGVRPSSRLRDLARAGPRRHGRRLSSPEQDHGANGGAQGLSAAT